MDGEANVQSLLYSNGSDQATPAAQAKWWRLVVRTAHLFAKKAFKSFLVLALKNAKVIFKAFLTF